MYLAFCYYAGVANSFYLLITLIQQANIYFSDNLFFYFAEVADL